MFDLEAMPHCGQRIRGILPQQAVTIVSVEVIGDSAEVFYQR